MLSTIILTKNEERNIGKCLESLQWCDEVLIIDDNSSDDTKTIARRFSATVIEHTLGNDFSQQRNFGLSVAKKSWVLFVDADEIISPSLQKEIQTVISNEENNGFFIKRVDTLWGREMTGGELSNIQLLRLAKKNSGRWKGKVHETWEVKGKTATLKNPILHYPHQALASFLGEINLYTSLRAEELYEQNIRSSFLAILLYPKAKFFLNYFLRKGYKDGLQGFLFAMIMSFHSFLVRAKLWMLWEKIK